MTAQVLAGVFLLQCAVAAWQLTQPRPARFGWQMYAGLSQPTEFSIITADGQRRIDLNDYVAKQRGDIDLITVLPSAICARESDALAVSFRVIPERKARSVPCIR